MKTFILPLSHSTFTELFNYNIQKWTNSYFFFILNSESQSKSEYIAQRNLQQKGNSVQAQERTDRR